MLPAIGDITESKHECRGKWGEKGRERKGMMEKRRGFMHEEGVLNLTEITHHR